MKSPRNSNVLVQFVCSNKHETNSRIVCRDNLIPVHRDNLVPVCKDNPIPVHRDNLILV